MEVDKEQSSTQSAGSVTSKSDHASKDEPAPEVDEQTRLWRTVGENPSDFTSWTSLLQKVEQKGDLLFAREVFNTFFKHYPYCYGYWKKLADFEKTHAGNDSAKQVFERGTESIALSVDIWMHYVKFTTTTESENKEGIRSYSSPWIYSSSVLRVHMVM